MFYSLLLNQVLDYSFMWASYCGNIKKTQHASDNRSEKRRCSDSANCQEMFFCLWSQALYPCKWEHVECSTYIITHISYLLLITPSCSGGSLEAGPIKKKNSTFTCFDKKWEGTQLVERNIPYTVECKSLAQKKEEKQSSFVHFQLYLVSLLFVRYQTNKNTKSVC